MGFKVNFYDNTTFDYYADDFNRQFKAVIGKDFVVGEKDFLIEPTSPASLKVKVGVGSAFIDGHYIVSDEEVQVDIPINSNQTDRKDFIVLELDDDNKTAHIKRVATVTENQLQLAYVIATNDTTAITSVEISNRAHTNHTLTGKVNNDTLAYFAKPETTVKRDFAGNIYATHLRCYSEGITGEQMTDKNYSGSFAAYSNGVPVFYDNVGKKVNYIHTDTTLKFEVGTWSPQLWGGARAFQLTASETFGHYQRIGNVIYVTGRIVWLDKNGATGPMQIKGLPFFPSVSYQVGNLGLRQGMPKVGGGDFIVDINGNGGYIRYDVESGGWADYWGSYAGDLGSFSFSAMYIL